MPKANHRIKTKTRRSCIVTYERRIFIHREATHSRKHRAMILRTFSIAFWFFSFLRFSSIRSQIHTVVYMTCVYSLSPYMYADVCVCEWKMFGTVSLTTQIQMPKLLQRDFQAYVSSLFGAQPTTVNRNERTIRASFSIISFSFSLYKHIQIAQNAH